MTPLEQEIVHLALLRRTSAHLTDQFKVLKDAFAAAHAELIQEITGTNAMVNASERTVRTLALDAYQAAPEAALPTGVKIVQRATIAYERAAALDWARRTRLALTPESLNEKAFEKIAKATPLDFVTLGTEPVVQIASDLSPLTGVTP